MGVCERIVGGAVFPAGTRDGGGASVRLDIWAQYLRFVIALLRSLETGTQLYTHPNGQLMYASEWNFGRFVPPAQGVAECRVQVCTTRKRCDAMLISSDVAK